MWNLLAIKCYLEYEKGLIQKNTGLNKDGGLAMFKILSGSTSEKIQKH